MQRSRLVIPTGPSEPSSPHFDDETTIVTARPVVPIAQAKAAERSRKSFLVGVGLLGAAVFGAIGAIAVNYLDRQTRAQSVAVTQPIATPASTPAPSPSPADLVVTPEIPLGGIAAATEPQQTIDPAEMPKPAVVMPSQTSPMVVAPPASSKTPESKTNSAIDPGQLIRKRRVHPPDPESDDQDSDERSLTTRKRTTGAGRIQEIFQGPNP